MHADINEIFFQIWFGHNLDTISDLDYDKLNLKDINIILLYIAQCNDWINSWALKEMFTKTLVT